jgi:hypothetical protein
MSEAEAAEELESEGPPRVKRKRAMLQHPMDRFLSLIAAVERAKGTRCVQRVILEATEPEGWTITIDLLDDEHGRKRESMHYDSPDELAGTLFRSIMAEFGAILSARAREAEEELMRCRSAIVRTLPPSERVPVTTRRRARRASVAAKPRRRRHPVAPEPETSEVDSHPLPFETPPEPSDGP